MCRSCFGNNLFLFFSSGDTWLTTLIPNTVQIAEVCELISSKMLWFILLLSLLAFLFLHFCQLILLAIFLLLLHADLFLRWRYLTYNRYLIDTRYYSNCRGLWTHVFKNVMVFLLLSLLAFLFLHFCQLILLAIFLLLFHVNHFLSLHILSLNVLRYLLVLCIVCIFYFMVLIRRYFATSHIILGISMLLLPLVFLSKYSLRIFIFMHLYLFVLFFCCFLIFFLPS